MGDAWVGRRTGGSGNTVSEDLHRETTGNRVTVDGSTSTILGVFKGNMLQRGRAQEGGFVAPRGDREQNPGHPGKLAGG